jgi:DNA-binding transcriptional MerR regulator
MTATDPIFTVSEMAEATGLTAHTLRYYEREGLIAPVERSDSSGHRTYGPEDLRAIEFLKRLRATGMPIALMRRYMSLVRQGDATFAERRAILVAHRDAVRTQIAEMQQHLEVIDYKIANHYCLPDGPGDSRAISGFCGDPQ